MTTEDLDLIIRLCFCYGGKNKLAWNWQCTGSWGTVRELGKVVGLGMEAAGIESHTWDDVWGAGYNISAVGTTCCVLNVCWGWGQGECHRQTKVVERDEEVGAMGWGRWEAVVGLASALLDRIRGC